MAGPVFSKKKEKVFERKWSRYNRGIFQVKTVKISQFCDGKMWNFQKLPGLCPGPPLGAYSTPQTPSWRRAVLRTACLALQDLPPAFFSIRWPNQFLFRCHGPDCRQALKMPNNMPIHAKKKSPRHGQRGMKRGAAEKMRGPAAPRLV